MTTRIAHGECGATWTGAASMHCSGCHQTFGGLSLFDAHRTGYGDRGSCKDPRAMRVGGLGLQLDDAAGVWRSQMPVEASARLRAA